MRIALRMAVVWAGPFETTCMVSEAADHAPLTCLWSFDGTILYAVSISAILVECIDPAGGQSSLSLQHIRKQECWKVE